MYVCRDCNMQTPCWKGFTSLTTDSAEWLNQSDARFPTTFVLVLCQWTGKWFLLEFSSQTTCHYSPNILINRRPWLFGRKVCTVLLEWSNENTVIMNAIKNKIIFLSAEYWHSRGLTDCCYAAQWQRRVIREDFKCFGHNYYDRTLNVARQADEKSDFIVQLPNLCTGTPRICNFYLVAVLLSKMLPSVKFVEYKVLTFLILREKC